MGVKNVKLMYIYMLKLLITKIWSEVIFPEYSNPESQDSKMKKLGNIPQ
jgi:hypothetical protein